MKKNGIWKPEKMEGEPLQNFAEWLNSWADFDKHPDGLDDFFVIGKNNKPNHITKFGEGYREAISDVMTKLGFDFIRFDKRTKTGFKKENHSE